MGTKNHPGKFDCHANALPDEPMFVLLARDPGAPELVEEWARSRAQGIAIGQYPASDAPKIMEAMDCAMNMRKWRVRNDGKWRVKTTPAPKACDVVGPNEGLE